VEYKNPQKRIDKKDVILLQMRNFLLLCIFFFSVTLAVSAKSCSFYSQESLWSEDPTTLKDGFYSEKTVPTCIFPWQMKVDYDSIEVNSSASVYSPVSFSQGMGNQLSFVYYGVQGSTYNHLKSVLEEIELLFGGDIF
jgi:hypothetical protein